MGAHTPADHLAVVEAKVDVLDEKADVLNGRVDVLTERVGGLDERVTVLDKKVTALDEKVDILDGRVTALDAKVSAFRGEVGAEFADARKEMRTGFAALEYQIGAIEERMHKYVATAIKASEEAVHRHMKVLHEEVVDRISRLGESRH
jgi:phage shock protein A